MEFIQNANLGIVTGVAIALFALPSYIGIMHQLGIPKGLAIIIILGVFALAIETLALKTGLPYGKFTYEGTALGTKLFGTTPWTVALAYPPLLLIGFWMATKFTRSFGRIVLTAIFATIIDLVLDPAMVKLGFWSWESPGPYFGVPIINFIGWLAVSLIGAFLLHHIWGKEHQVKRSAAYSGLAILVFWTGANWGVEQWVPLSVGMVSLLLIVIVMHLEKKYPIESEL